jgi:hypothetical protein
MVDVTVVIPVGPGHERLADRAAASVAGQTHPTACVRVSDSAGRGPGWARNEGLRQVETPFVVFLDADDVIAPSFVARTLAHVQPNRYVYTDWWEGTRYTRAPDCAWMGGTWHVVTALVPTAAARQVSGFDEDLPGGEDTDFYLKLQFAGVCGFALHEGLFAYTNAGTRGHEFVHGGTLDRVQDEFTRRYGGRMRNCCGEPNQDQPQALGGHPDGVEAVALWRGNRRQRGAATGYLYPRAGNERRLQVHPADIEASPHLFQRIVRREKRVPSWVPADDDDGFEQMARAFADGMGYVTPIATPRPKPLAQAGQPTPNVARVLALYRSAM